MPSGDQAEEVLSPLDVIARALLPSAFITQICDPVYGSERSKAILLPSGDHAGSCLSPGPLVSANAFAPFASITQIWKSSDGPPRAKTIRFATGDQSGVVFSPFVVSACASVPSAFTAQICESLYRPARVNAIWDPSGDHVGEYLSSGPAVTGCASLPSPFMVQICRFSDCPPRANAMRSVPAALAVWGAIATSANASSARPENLRQMISATDVGTVTPPVFWHERLERAGGRMKQVHERRRGHSASWLAEMVAVHRTPSVQRPACNLDLRDNTITILSSNNEKSRCSP